MLFFPEQYSTGHILNFKVWAVWVRLTLRHCSPCMAHKAVADACVWWWGYDWSCRVSWKTVEAWDWNGPHLFWALQLQKLCHAFQPPCMRYARPLTKLSDISVHKCRHMYIENQTAVTRCQMELYLLQQASLCTGQRSRIRWDRLATKK